MSMSMESYVNQQLYAKMHKEFSNFTEKLASMEPKKIMEKAYEKIFKEEILMVIENKELPIKQAVALLRSEQPLEYCYQDWLKSDANYLEDLRDSVERCANSFCKSSKEQVVGSR